MLRGTRIIKAELFNEVVAACREVSTLNGYEELILPSIWEQKTFISKAGAEIIGQMYAFQDKKGRDICLIPEATAIIQHLYKTDWVKSMPKPVRVSYLARCYRYERPQKGRYREFWQWGCELLGGKNPQDSSEIIDLLKKTLKNIEIPYSFAPSIKRGLDYYIEDGFEAECESLGTQKQIAGGGRYDCGIGFAIGIDRLLEVKKARMPIRYA